MNNKTLVLFLFCLVGFTEAVGAQPSLHAECESSSACVSLFEQAQQQSKAGQLAEAEKSYKLAYEVSHDPRLLFNIARVLDKQGQEPEALTYYQPVHRCSGRAIEEQKTKARGVRSAA
jgi:predicted negative regulator of RcsB-dependent stress response